MLFRYMVAQKYCILLAATQSRKNIIFPSCKLGTADPGEIVFNYDNAVPMIASRHEYVLTGLRPDFGFIVGVGPRLYGKHKPQHSRVRTLRCRW
jgi:hypothetical protein